MTIFLIRHGETALNAARVLQPPDTPLSPRGLVQAEALARRLAALRPAAVLSSDQPRAARTAEAIASACRLTVQPSELLRERHFGEWRGRAYDDLPADVLRSEAPPPGGESGAAFRARVDAGFVQILQGHAALAGAGPLVVVSHGLVIWDLLARHLDRAGAPMPTHLGNTSLTVFAAHAPHAVRLLACTRHLEGETAVADDPRALCGG
ncbi:histidine phosphatase family protein [Sphaerotilus microaerophilus]|uniref:Phosphoglycerate mutase n=1 Tax=Sphaerotilus microaerophilus TaxID=2914710 RepID=A0ABM7YLQ3_9BURK|nr:histidine phosphatase family protein [Sphaerotilus sp. FB-5]BDI05377.1 phosphoglycerate mutase [Sphaerotilus sp. FB-5]